MIYREDGFVAEVELLEKKPEARGKTEGSVYTMKVVKVHRVPAHTGVTPTTGAVFTVWAANDSPAHHPVWSLGDC